MPVVINDVGNDLRIMVISHMKRNPDKFPQIFVGGLAAYFDPLY